MKLAAKAFGYHSTNMFVVTAFTDIRFTKIIIKFAVVLLMMRCHSNIVLINFMMMKCIERQYGDNKNCREE